MPRPARCRACGATTLPRCSRAQLPYVKPLLETFGSTIREDLNIDAFGAGCRRLRVSGRSCRRRSRLRVGRRRGGWSRGCSRTWTSAWWLKSSDKVRAIPPLTCPRFEMALLLLLLLPLSLLLVLPLLPLPPSSCRCLSRHLRNSSKAGHAAGLTAETQVAEATKEVQRLAETLKEFEEALHDMMDMVERQVPMGTFETLTNEVAERFAAIEARQGEMEAGLDERAEDQSSELAEVRTTMP